MGSLKGTGRVTVTLMMLVGSVMTQGGGHYTVVAPDTVRPNTNYLASISVDGTGGDLQVSLTKSGHYSSCGLRHAISLAGEVIRAVGGKKR